MKRYFVFLSLCLYAICFAQYNYYKIDTVKVATFDQLKNQSFYQTVDAKDLLHYITSSEKKYKMVFTFTYWCKPCREIHPDVLKLQKDYKNLDVFFVTDVYNANGFNQTEKYLTEINNSAPIFSLGYDEKLANTKGKYIYQLYNVDKNKMTKVGRYDYFIQKLIPKHKDYGYSLIILYNDKDEVVYASTFNETDNDVFLKLKTILN